jgi:ribokinase
VLDTTGAGDTFCGAFMASLLQDGDLQRAARSGSAAASFAVEDYGLDRLLRVSSGELQLRMRFG